MPPTFTPDIQPTILKSLIKILKRLHLRGFHPLRQDIPVKFQLHIKGPTLGLINTTSTHNYSQVFSLSSTVFARRY